MLDMGYLNPNNLFIFSGSNLNFVEAIKFGELVTEKLYYMSNTGISGLVPDTSEISPSQSWEF